MTYQLGPGPSLPEIGEEQLVESQGRVRALIVARYEEAWQWVKDSKDLAEADGRPLDPRIMEIGLRATKELSLLYRMGKPLPPAEADEDEAVSVDERLALLADSLLEVEARQQSRDEAARIRREGRLTSP